MKRTIAALLLAATLAVAPGTAYADPQYRQEAYWQVNTYLWYLFGSIFVGADVVVTNGEAPRCDAGWPYWCEIDLISYCTYVYFDNGTVQGQCGNF